ncbi:hypothetical protein SAMN02799620_05745 [Mycolicibacterium fluoranthenivorans]|uniref:Uncharacterized protein n=1 Tax=Mycolicibacterium fluoranthenivorans TaxID=258505 RepID=A0A1G4WZM5_9MYCO|nr:hypothetical protein SAMN02799620_05745 [Mycolicibacterium fluoranthenivorans]
MSNTASAATQPAGKVAEATQTLAAKPTAQVANLDEAMAKSWH